MVTTEPFSVTSAPIFFRISKRICTSEISGTFSMRHWPSTRSTAGKIASAAFFAPLMVTVPCKVFPPLITYLAKEYTLPAMILPAKCRQPF